MNSSALEREIQHGLIRLRGFFRLHDRGVLLGLIFGCIPLPPLALIGFLISLFNLWLWKNRKLNYDEIRIIGPALLIALLNTLLGILLLHFMLTAILGVNWLRLLEQWQAWVKGWLYFLWPFNWLPHKQGGSSI